jgi:hypothetical protein
LNGRSELCAGEVNYFCVVAALGRSKFYKPADNLTKTSRQQRLTLKATDRLSNTLTISLSTGNFERLPGENERQLEHYLNF